MSQKSLGGTALADTPLKMKLELYESAGILDESVDFIFNGVSARAVPPRLFCDICDEFDLHDTEDCPTQASSTIVEEEKSHTKKHSKRGVVREYCDTCEIFGHSTESCTEAESY
jgi:CAP-Gly domain-containing linker protein 1